VSDERMGHAGWIGVDLDGTLAHYDEWRGVFHIGEPVPAMVARVKRWLAEGREVRVMTARVSRLGGEALDARQVIELWCHQHIGRKLPVTHEKDFAMIELWDDRAVQVTPNTGTPIDPSRWSPEDLL
jgi:hypothetical protein